MSNKLDGILKGNNSEIIKKKLKSFKNQIIKTINERYGLEIFIKDIKIKVERNKSISIKIFLSKDYENNSNIILVYLYNLERNKEYLHFYYQDVNYNPFQNDFFDFKDNEIFEKIIKTINPNTNLF